MSVEDDRLCIGFQRGSDGTWRLLMAVVDDEHDWECRGRHGRCIGKFVGAGDGGCQDCGGGGKVYRPAEPGWPATCVECIKYAAMAAWVESSEVRAAVRVWRY